MTTAQQVLDVARSQLGTVEARDGSTPYHRAYGLPADQPWCAVFVWWCFQQAAAGNLTHEKTAYTPTLAGWFKQRNQWTVATPTVGALIFYDWPDTLRRIQHVGIVESFDATTVTAIEGNTSSGTAGSQSNGGGVWRRRRARNSSIAGYGHPAYSSASEEDDLTPDQDQMLRAVYRELTLRLPNRRGPNGQEIPGGGADTALGYSANADGFLFQIYQHLASGGGLAAGALSDEDLHRVADAVADEQARRLAG